MITIQKELAAEAWDEFIPLVVDHCAEIVQDAPDLDKEVMLLLEEQGSLRCFTVRDDGKAVGYAIYVLETNVMEKTRFVARDVGLYLAKSHRGGITVVRLLKYAETSMIPDGVVDIYQNIPADSPVGALLEKMGYDRIEEVFRKRLIEGEPIARMAQTR